MGSSRLGGASLGDKGQTIQRVWGHFGGSANRPFLHRNGRWGRFQATNLGNRKQGLSRGLSEKKKAQHVVVARAQKMFCGQDTHMLRSVSMNRTIQNLLKATPSMFMLKRAPKRCLSLIEWMLRTSWKAFPRENVWWMLVCSHPSLFKDWKRDAEYPVHHQYIQSVYNEACSRLQWIIHLSTPFRYLRCTMD